MAASFSTVSMQAKRLIQRGQLDKAFAAWEAFLEGADDESAASALNQMGDLCLRQKNPVGGIDQFLRAADAFDRAGYPLKAIATLKKALKVDPSRAEIYIRMGDLNARREFVGNAVEAYLSVARLMVAAGDTDGALDMVRKVRILDPVNIRHRLQLAAELFELNFTAEATDETINAIDMFLQEENLEEAERYCRHLLDLDSNNAEARERLGKIAAWGTTDRSSAAADEVSDSSIDDLFAALDAGLDDPGASTAAPVAATPTVAETPTPTPTAVPPAPESAEPTRWGDLEDPAATTAATTVPAQADAPIPSMPGLESHSAPDADDTTGAEIRRKAFHYLDGGEFDQSLEQFDLFVTHALAHNQVAEADAALKAYIAIDPENPRAQEVRLRIFAGRETEKDLEILARLVTLWGDLDAEKATEYQACHDRLSRPDALRTTPPGGTADHADTSPGHPIDSPADTSADTPAPEVTTASAPEPPTTDPATETPVAEKPVTADEPTTVESTATAAPTPAPAVAPGMSGIDRPEWSGAPMPALPDALRMDGDDPLAELAEPDTAVPEAVAEGTANNDLTRISLDGIDTDEITAEDDEEPVADVEAEPAEPVAVIDLDDPDALPTDDDPMFRIALEGVEPTASPAQTVETESAAPDGIAEVVIDSGVPHADPVASADGAGSDSFTLKPVPVEAAAPPEAAAPVEDPLESLTLDNAGEMLSQRAFQLREALAEATFYEHQNLPDEAIQLYREILAAHPGQPTALARLDDLGVDPVAAPPTAAHNDMATAMPAIEVAPRIPQPATPPATHSATTGDEFSNLASEIQDALSDQSEGQWKAVSHDARFDEILSAFRTGIQAEISDDDVETHYDLGVAYREMGLLEEAISELQIAAKGSGRFADSNVMLAGCFTELGKPHLAIEQLRSAVTDREHDNEAWVALTYELGLLLEGSGAAEEARQLFEQIYARDIGFRDVANRVASLS